MDEYVKFEIHAYQELCKAQKDIEEVDNELKQLYALARKLRIKKETIAKRLGVLLHGAKIE